MTAKSIGIAEEQGERVLLTRAAREEIATMRSLKQRIFYASCMYGNTFTLPLLILSSLLASGFGGAGAGASTGALQERAVTLEGAAARGSGRLGQWTSRLEPWTRVIVPDALAHLLVRSGAESCARSSARSQVY